MNDSSSGAEQVRVFLAGATGAIGHALVPKLVKAGYQVTAMTRSPAKVDMLGAAGADPVVCDVFDRDGLRAAVQDAQPNVIINQLTRLPKSGLKPRKLGRYYEDNNRVRREGTQNLLDAAREVGATRFIGQSIAFWYDPQGDPIKDEQARLWLSAPAPIGEAAKALEESERALMRADFLDGIVLRYGVFYGPGTWYSPSGEIGQQMCKRQYPNIGAGQGITSFIHVDDAADVCVAFVESGRPGVYNVVDDEPATANEWMPEFAKAVGAKPPRRVPAGLAKVIAGKGLVEWTTTARGASNAKVKRELGWQPIYPSWRQGFASGLGDS
jgi:nucleoside-diphosphate-sugar epimerase